MVEQEKKTSAKQGDATPDTFTKEQLLASRRYAHRKDLLQVLLEEERGYTLAETDELMQLALKKEV